MENYSTYNTIHNYTHISNLWASKISIHLIHKTTEKYRVHLPTSDKSAPARRNQTLLLQCEWTQSPTTPHTKAVRESRTANSSIPRQISNQPAKHRIPTNVSHQQYLFKTKSKTVYTNPFHSETINIYTFNQHTGLITVSKTTCTVCQIIWLR